MKRDWMVKLIYDAFDLEKMLIELSTSGWVIFQVMFTIALGWEFVIVAYKDCPAEEGEPDATE